MRSLLLKRRLWVGLLLVVVGGGYAYGRRHPFAPQRVVARQSKVVHYVTTQQPVIALTFDDGPHPVFTPKVLNILKRYRVPATFFMVGVQMEKHPDLVNRVWQEGHAIANHTYSHRRLYKLTWDELSQEVSKTEGLVTQFTRQSPRLLRPPWGMYSQQVCRFARQEGYHIVLWTVCVEHHDTPTPEAMAQRVLKKARPGGIILAHDGSTGEKIDRSRTVQSLPLIIEGLQKKGYRFVTVPDLMKEGAADNEGLCSQPKRRNQPPKGGTTNGARHETHLETASHPRLSLGQRIGRPGGRADALRQLVSLPSESQRGEGRVPFDARAARARPLAHLRAALR